MMVMFKETLEQEVIRLREENAELRRKLERIGIYARAHIKSEERMLYIYQNESDTTKKEISDMVEDKFKQDVIMVLECPPTVL